MGVRSLQKPGDWDLDFEELRFGDPVSGEWAAYVRKELPEYVSPRDRDGTGPFTLWDPDTPTASKVVDDKANGFAKYRSGWKKQSVGFDGRSFWTPVRNASVKRYATWRATLDVSGTYEVKVKVPKRKATTSRATYKVVTANGVKTVKRNQKQTAGRWVKLGTFDFDTLAEVKLIDKTGEPTSSGRTIVADVVKFVLATAAAAAPDAKKDIASQPGSQPKPDAIVVKPEVRGDEVTATKLRLYPMSVSAVPGARKVVSAWTCPADDHSSFGVDRTPGTGDDRCDPVEAHWRLEDEQNARLNERHAHKVLVQLATETDNRLIATYEDKLQGLKLIAKPRPEGTVVPPLYKAYEPGQ